MSSRLKKILVVGQTPPPFGGQAVMIEKLIKGKFNNVELHHVRMIFSREMDEMGTFQIRKLFVLLSVVMRIVACRVRHGANILYYPPSGPTNLPLMRDIFILTCTRWMFKQTIFQFFAGGTTGAYEGMSTLKKWVFRKCYFNPDLTLRPCEQSTDDGAFLNTRRDLLINWATEKQDALVESNRDPGEPPRILYVGVVMQNKGAYVLLQACAKLKEQGLDFSVVIMGKFESKAFEKKAKDFVEANDLSDRVTFPGVKTGEAYYQEYANADIFCFPTFFESENVPVVTLDASQYGLPMISTHWRGLPSVIDDNENGFLVPPNDFEAITEKLLLLLTDTDLRRTMGQRARQRYLDDFVLEVFYKKMNDAFDTLD